MPTISKNTQEYRNNASKQERKIYSLASQARRFLSYFLEMQVPMGLGALVCFLLVRLIPASSSFGTIYHPGTYLFASGDLLFISVPVMVWLVLRGHSWQHSAEMGAAMLMPVAVILLLAWLSTAAYDYLLWLIISGYPLMCLGMLVYMLCHRDYFTTQIDSD